MLAQLGGVGLGPLGGAQQARLLAVPGGVDEGALRLPAALRQLAHRARASSSSATKPLTRVEAPLTQPSWWFAADHPLVRPLGAGNPGDHIVDRLQTPVERQLEVDAGGAGAEVIGNGKGAFQSYRRHGAAEGLEQRQSVAVGDREDGDLGDRRRVLDGEALGVLGGTDAGGQRISGVERHVGH